MNPLSKVVHFTSIRAFGGQEFKVTDVDADSDSVEVQIGGEPVWMPAGPITEVQN